MNKGKPVIAGVFIFLLIANGAVLGYGGSVFANESPLKFSVRLFPTKLIEQSESQIEISPLMNGKLFPKKIQDITITSQNPEILKVIGKKHTDDFTTIVNIETKKQGETKISLAAPGFESAEFPVKVHHNNRNEKKIIINTLPDKFSINGPNKGYVSVELLDEDGAPIVAREDVTITLTASNTKSIHMQSKEMIIEKGNYYAIQEFSVEQFDDSVIIYASAPNVETAETTINVVTPTKPFKIKLFVNPDRASRSSITNSFAIVQLQDANGNPIRATEDIPVSVKIKDPFAGSIMLNENGRIPQISPSSTIVIKKGEYWDATKLVTNAGISGKYTVSISAKGYDVSPPQILEIVESGLVENRNVVFDPVPVLSTGGEQLVGVVHLEDDSEKLLLVNENLEFRIFSSDASALSIDRVKIEKGQSSAAVYGTLGYYKPDSLNIHEAYENKELPAPAIFGPRKATLKLVSEPLVPKIMSNSNTPIVTYITASDGSNWYFPTETDLFFSPSDLLDIAPQSAEAGSGAILMDGFSQKEGSETLLVKSGTLSTEMTIENHMTLPTKMELDIPKRIFTGVKNKMVAQILDNDGKPLFANSDIDIKMISNDESIVNVPDNFTIKRGESFAVIDLLPTKKGSIELAVLSTGFPLLKKSINVEELKPDIKFDSPKTVEPNTSFVSSILVTMDGQPISDMDVSWNVMGADVHERQGTTDKDGKSSIVLLSGNKTVNLSVDVSNEIFPTATYSNTIKTNFTSDANRIEAKQNKTFDVFGIDIFLILVPAGIIISGIAMKKKGKMSMRNN